MITNLAQPQQQWHGEETVRQDSHSLFCQEVEIFYEYLVDTKPATIEFMVMEILLFTATEANKM